MFRRNTLIFIMIFLSFAILLVLTGCPGPQPGDKPADIADDNGGRVVQPPTPSAPVGGSDDNNGQSNGGSDTGQGTGTSPNEPIGLRDPEAKIEFWLLVNGVRQSIDEPVYSYDGEQKRIEFAINATGSELASFHIESGAPVDIPRDGELTGYSANIPYIFTYDSRTWGDEGILLSVKNQQGDVTMANIFVTNPPDQPR